MPESRALAKTGGDLARRRGAPSAEPGVCDPETSPVSSLGAAMRLATPLDDPTQRYRSALQRLPSTTLRQQFVAALGRQQGNAWVQRILTTTPASPSIGQRSAIVQRSWIDDRIGEVRTATQADNWGGSDPPGAYYVLNGMSMDDMVRILRGVSPADRKKLADNLDEHGTGFDMPRIHLGLTNASTKGDDAFRELSENLHWGIRSGNFTEPPNGAFVILAKANGDVRARLLAALNRDSLDALIDHRSEAVNVAGGPEVLAAITKKRSGIGQTSRERHLLDLIKGNAWSQFFTEWNTINEAYQLRFLRSSIDAVEAIRDHLKEAEGIADLDRLHRLIGTATKSARDVPVQLQTTGYRPSLHFGLLVNLGWRSSSGVLSDLANCKVRETITYSQIPNPPFGIKGGGPPKESGTTSHGPKPEPKPAAMGVMSDTHRTPAEWVQWPPREAAYTVTQTYDYRIGDAGDRWIPFGHYVITCAIRKNGDQWEFVTTKQGQREQAGETFESVETISAP